jgi:hypothetical protein
MLGPFNSNNGPLTCHERDGGAIDPSTFHDPATNRRFVVYKVDGNNAGNGGSCGNSNPPIHSTPIMLQELSGDGVTPIGYSTQILDRGEADGPLIEAPSIGRIGNKYFLFFSSNCYSDQWYDTSFAMADSVWGPYRKSKTPLLTTGVFGGLFAPGGLEIASDSRHVAFHAGPLGARFMYFGRVETRGSSFTLTVDSDGMWYSETIHP